MPDGVPVVVAVAIVRDGDRVLVSRRPPGEHLAGKWEFPGGKVHPGERADDAARRECREELGIDPGALEPLTFVSHDYGDRKILLIAFTAGSPAIGSVMEEAGGKPMRREARWVPVEELRRLDMPAANDAIIERLTTATRGGPGPAVG